MTQGTISQCEHLKDCESTTHGTVLDLRIRLGRLSELNTLLNFKMIHPLLLVILVSKVRFLYR